MLFPPISLYLYVRMYACCVISTDCPGLDFDKFTIVSGFRNHDYINDSHVPNGLNCYMA